MKKKGQSRREFRTEAYVALAYFRGRRRRGTRAERKALSSSSRPSAVASSGAAGRGDAPSGTIRPDGCVLSPPCPSAWFVQRPNSVPCLFLSSASPPTTEAALPDGGVCSHGHMGKRPGPFSKWLRNVHRLFRALFGLSHCISLAGPFSTGQLDNSIWAFTIPK